MHITLAGTGLHGHVENITRTTIVVKWEDQPTCKTYRHPNFFDLLDRGVFNRRHA